MAGAIKPTEIDIQSADSRQGIDTIHSHIVMQFVGILLNQILPAHIHPSLLPYYA